MCLSQIHYFNVGSFLRELQIYLFLVNKAGFGLEGVSGFFFNQFFSFFTIWTFHKLQDPIGKIWQKLKPPEIEEVPFLHTKWIEMNTMLSGDE